MHPLSFTIGTTIGLYLISSCSVISLCRMCGLFAVNRTADRFLNLYADTAAERQRWTDAVSFNVDLSQSLLAGEPSTALFISLQCADCVYLRRLPGEGGPLSTRPSEQLDGRPSAAQIPPGIGPEGGPQAEASGAGAQGVFGALLRPGESVVMAGESPRIPYSIVYIHAHHRPAVASQERS